MAEKRIDDNIEIKAHEVIKYSHFFQATNLLQYHVTAYHSMCACLLINSKGDHNCDIGQLDIPLHAYTMHRKMSQIF